MMSVKFWVLHWFIAKSMNHLKDSISMIMCTEMSKPLWFWVHLKFSPSTRERAYNWLRILSREQTCWMKFSTEILTLKRLLFWTSPSTCMRFLTLKVQTENLKVLLIWPTLKTLCFSKNLWHRCTFCKTNWELCPIPKNLYKVIWIVQLTTGSSMVQQEVVKQQLPNF